MSLEDVFRNTNEEFESFLKNCNWTDSEREKAREKWAPHQKILAISTGWSFEAVTYALNSGVQKERERYREKACKDINLPLKEWLEKYKIILPSNPTIGEFAKILVVFFPENSYRFPSPQPRKQNPL